jgi:ubiquinone/menaquinone biosynthesis C-methylase UbiE
VADHSDVHRFDQWARTYDRHWMQRFIFDRVHRTVLELAAQEAVRPRAILDIGCGTGRLLRAAERRFAGAELVGVDAAGEMARQAETSKPPGSRIRFQQATAEDLPFHSAHFDLVFSTLTFHHWHEQNQGMAEVARVLTPGGRWLLADFIPTGYIKYIRRILRLHQFRERRELEAMLAGAGLAVASERRVPGLGGQVRVLALTIAEEPGKWQVGSR